MRTVNIHEAKTHLSRFLEEAAAGNEIVIARAGRPLARLVPLESSKARITLGSLQGKMSIPHDFEAPLPKEIIDAFEQ